MSALYGSPGRPGNEAARELVEELGLAPTEVAQCLELASAGRRPYLRTIDELADVDPAVFYYFERLATEVAKAKGRPAPPAPSSSSSSPATNRPNYAPERRPGDPLDGDLENGPRELVVFAFGRYDVRIIAELIEAGAAAFKYAPTDGGLTTVNRRRSVIKLGKAVARELRAELERVDGRDQDLRDTLAARQRAQDRAARAEAKRKSQA